jgi:hypothetical protein
MVALVAEGHARFLPTVAFTVLWPLWLSAMILILIDDLEDR